MASTSDIRAGGAVVEVRADTSKVADDIDKGVLHELKRGLGGRSEFKEMFELLKGGGAVVGLGVAAEAVGHLAEGLTKAKEAIIDVNKNAADVGQSLLRALPAGELFVNAGESVNNFFTGQKDAMEEAKRTSDAADDAIKKHAEHVKSATDSYRTLDEAIRHIRERGQLIPGSPLGRNVPGFLAPFGAGGVKAFQTSGGELTGLLGSTKAERDKFAGPGGEDLRRAQGNLADLTRQLAEAKERVRHVEEREAQNVNVVGADKIRAEHRDLADKVRAAREDVNSRKATVAGIDSRQTEGVFAAFYNFGRDIAHVARDALAESFKAEQEKIRASNLVELQAYDAQDADDAARDNARAEAQLRDLDKRNARNSGQSEILNDLANQKQSILDSILPKGEQLEQQRQYAESLGLGGADLEKYMRQQADSILGTAHGIGQFGGAGAENVFGGGVEERIAKGVEETAKNTKTIVNSSPRFR